MRMTIRPGIDIENLGSRKYHCKGVRPDNLENSCGIKKYEWDDREPRKVKKSKKRCENEVPHNSYRDSARSKQRPQDTPHNRIIFVKRFKKVAKCHSNRKRPLKMRNSSHECPQEPVRRINVPVPEKTFQSEE